MGRESTTYIGPYLEIISGGTYEEPYIGCPDHGRMSSDYCPKCGKKVIQLETTETYRHDINTMTGELVWQPDYMPEDRDIWLYNRIERELETQSIYDIDPLTLGERLIKEIQSFTEELKESGNLKALDEKGIKYRIGFGVINYAHWDIVTIRVRVFADNVMDAIDQAIADADDKNITVDIVNNDEASYEEIGWFYKEYRDCV